MRATDGQDSVRYDVVVVGGGAAGLSGALTLGRARRSVLVVDGGEPRNAPASGVHGFLTRDGVNPSALLEAGREALAVSPRMTARRLPDRPRGASGRTPRGSR